MDAPLRKDYEAAREKGRTGLTCNAWRDEELTQIAVAWILSGVFVRLLVGGRRKMMNSRVGTRIVSRLESKVRHEYFIKSCTSLSPAI